MCIRETKCKLQPVEKFASIRYCPPRQSFGSAPTHTPCPTHQYPRGQSWDLSGEVEGNQLRQALRRTRPPHLEPPQGHDELLQARLPLPWPAPAPLFWVGFSGPGPTLPQQPQAPSPARGHHRGLELPGVPSSHPAYQSPTTGGCWAQRSGTESTAGQAAFLPGREAGAAAQLRPWCCHGGVSSWDRGERPCMATAETESSIQGCCLRKARWEPAR